MEKERQVAILGIGWRPYDEKNTSQRSNTRNEMKYQIKTGTVFVENGTRMPTSLTTESGPYLKGWASVGGPAWRQLRNSLNAAGWTYFNIGIELKVTVLGFDRQKMVSKAVQRLSILATSRACNCLELSRMTRTRWFQMPSLTVYAHARKVQESTSVWPPNGWTTLLQRCLQRP